MFITEIYMDNQSLQGSSIYDMNEYDSNEFIDIQEKTGNDSKNIHIDDIFESLKSQVDVYFHSHNLQLKELLTVQKNTFNRKLNLI